jgi:hypothetical protein
MVIDAHQHLWTEPLLEALAARRALPLVRWEHGARTLHLAGEPHCPIAADDPAVRNAQLDEDGVDLALVLPSTPLGIEALAPDVARELLAAHVEGVRAFGSRFARWGAIPLAEPDPADVDHELDRGAVGLSLPAGIFRDPRDLDRVGPLLERLTARGAALFVHPGPNPWSPPAPASSVDIAWWPALTTYVEQMQRAWLTIVTEGLVQHPQLRVLFALLAGGAPLQAERLAARGGPVVDPGDARLFYDTSSHGPLALAGLGVTGAQLVHGSDRPVTPPGTPPTLARAGEAPARLLGSFLPSTPPVTA